MTTFLIEIEPKKENFDPLAKQVKAELVELGEPVATAAVATRRLYRLEGSFTLAQVDQMAKALLVDPVVETSAVSEEGKAVKGKAEKPKGAWVLDIWPKPGVTDPVGETVEKGLRDLGFSGPAKAHSATRYVFPKVKSENTIRTLARRSLANELIHDIHVRKI